MNSNSSKSITANKPKTKLICFTLGHQVFGIPISNVCEVIIPPFITPLIHTDKVIKGVLNLRGSIIMILDIKAIFGIQQEPQLETDDPRIIIIDNDGKFSGILVDKMEKSLDIPESQIILPKESGLEKSLNYCIGTIELDQKSLTIIDIEKLHSIPQITELRN